MKHLILAFTAVVLVQEHAYSKTAEMIPYQEMLSEWQQGKAASMGDLIGRWKLVAIDTNDPFCATLISQQTDLNGIKNYDGSDRMSLLFAEALDAKPNLILSVENLGEAGADQGLQLVVPSRLTFRLSAYPRNPGRDPKGLYSLTCLKARSAADGLICKVQLRVSKDVPDYDPNAICASKENAAMVEFRK